jgi:NAD-dependent dihydropyrimidine dehydrogenase PreA subunit
MIELVIDDLCFRCDACVRICPTNVLEAVPGGSPIIARQEDCQTCFICELYCPADALYVAPRCEGPTPVDEAEIRASGLLGQYRRDSGWSGQPGVTNQHWRMEDIFARARLQAAAQTPTAPSNPKEGENRP